MDCFFAAVEVLDDPRLADRPVVVGGTGARGVVASASYLARVAGVRSAMPTATARRLCPDAAFLPGRFDRYRSVSAALRSILTDVTPLVEPVALDEAYLDVSGAHRRSGPSCEIAAGLRLRVRRELGLDCAVGVGRTKLVAKLASKAAKPVVGPAGVEPGPGVVVVPAADELAFVSRHPVRALPGVGPKTAERLGRYGISAVGDLAAVSDESLERLLGASLGRQVHRLARGDDTRPVVAVRAARSIGHEETFDRDIRDLSALERHVRAAAERVASRCTDGAVVARTVTVKVRLADFSTVTRSRTLSSPTASAAVVAGVATALLRELAPRAGVRLVGVQVSGLADGSRPRVEQLELFAEPPCRSAAPPGAHGPGTSTRVAVAAVADAIRRRYGPRAIAAAADAVAPAPTRPPLPGAVPVTCPPEACGPAACVVGPPALRENGAVGPRGQRSGQAAPLEDVTLYSPGPGGV